MARKPEAMGRLFAKRDRHVDDEHDVHGTPEAPPWGSGGGGGSHGGHDEGGSYTSLEDRETQDDDESPESNESRESHEGAEEFSDYVEQLLEKLVPQFEELRDNFREVVTAIQENLPLTLDKVKAYLSAEISKIKEKLGGVKEKKAEAPVAKAQETLASLAPETVAERLRDAQERAAKVEAYNAAQDALQAIVEEREVIPQGGSHADVAEEVVQRAEERAARIKEAINNLKAATEDMNAVSAPSTVEAATEVVTSTSPEVEAVVHADEEAPEAPHYATEHHRIEGEMNRLLNELHEIKDTLGTLTTPERLNRKIDDNYTLHAFEADRDLRRELLPQMNEIIDKLRELTGAVGPAMITLLEGEDREELEEQMEALTRALEFAKKQPQNAKERIATAQASLLRERTESMEALHPGELPPEIEDMLDPNDVALRQNRRNLAGHAERFAVRPESDNSSLQERTQNLRAAMLTLMQERDGLLGNREDKEINYRIYREALNRFHDAGGSDMSFTQLLLRTAESLNEETTTQSMAGPSHMNLIQAFMQENDITHPDELVQRLPDYMKNQEKAYNSRSNTKVYAKHVKTVRKIIERFGKKLR